MLVPEYLSQVPEDPYGDGPLIYRRTEGEFILYSVGADGEDDGGELVPGVDAIWGEGDFFLDMFDLEEQ